MPGEELEVWRLLGTYKISSNQWHTYTLPIRTPASFPEFETDSSNQWEHTIEGDLILPQGEGGPSPNPPPGQQRLEASFFIELSGTHNHHAYIALNRAYFCAVIVTKGFCKALKWGYRLIIDMEITTQTKYFYTPHKLSRDLDITRRLIEYDVGLDFPSLTSVMFQLKCITPLVNFKPSPYIVCSIYQLLYTPEIIDLQYLPLPPAIDLPGDLSI